MMAPGRGVELWKVENIDRLKRLSQLPQYSKRQSLPFYRGDIESEKGMERSQWT